MTNNNRWGDVKFLHYRILNSDNSLAPKGGATVAYVVHDDGTIRWARARCHEKDRYDKNLGRIKSAGRLLSRPLSVVDVATQQGFIEEQDWLYNSYGMYRNRKENK